MKLALDVDTLQFLDPTDLDTTISAGSVRRGDILPVELQFVRAGSVIELSSPTINLYVVNAGDYDSLLASASSFTQVGSGIETVYEQDLDMSGAAVNALFASGATEQDDAILEVQFEVGGNKESSLPMDLTIHNSYTP